MYIYSQNLENDKIFIKKDFKLIKEINLLVSIENHIGAKSPNYASFYCFFINFFFYYFIESSNFLYNDNYS